MTLTMNLPAASAISSPIKNGQRSFSYRPVEEICYGLSLPAEDVAAKRQIVCPHCGVKKFRVSKPETGRCGCDACGCAYKDYTALWADLKNDDWRTACQATRVTNGKSTGLSASPTPSGSRTLRTPSKSRPSEVASPPRLTNLKPADDMSLGLMSYTNKKQGILDALKAFGAMVGEFRQGEKSKPQPVIAIPAFEETLRRPINYQILGVHGPIKIREKNEAGDWVTVLHKTYTAERGTPDGVIMAEDDRLAIVAGDPIENLVLLKAEGPPDCMAAYLLSRDTGRRVIPFTNLYGARTLHCARSLLPLLAKLKPVQCLTCHDCDEAGQLGAVRKFPDVGWANLLRDIGEDSRNVLLPYEVVPKKGKDLRDWIGDGGNWTEFEKLIEAADRILEKSPLVDLQRTLDDAMDSGLGEAATIDGTEVVAIAGEGEGNSDGPELISVGQLTIDHVQMRREVIGGLLRVGEVMTAIAPPKRGKSWLVSGLAWSVAAGRDWLGFPTMKGRVLMIDNELHPETISNRLWKISKGMEIEIEDGDERIDLLPLRGNLCDIDALTSTLVNSIDPGQYSLIILDALYRMLPAGISENDNAGMTQVFNTLDRLSSRLKCGVVVVHHTSKGDQGGKAITDTGAGAGSVARAADTHLIIRPHVDDEHVVLEAVTRSFIDPAPISIRFDFPLWNRSDLPPDVRRDTPRDVEQRKNDAEADARMLSELAASGELSQSELKSRTGYGDARIARSLARLVDAKKVHREKSFKQNTGKMSDRYSICESEEEIE